MPHAITVISRLIKLTVIRKKKVDGSIAYCLILVAAGNVLFTAGCLLNHSFVSLTLFMALLSFNYMF